MPQIINLSKYSKHFSPVLYNCSFSDWVFISDHRMREVVMQYAIKGLHYEQLVEMNHLCNVHVVC